MTYRIQPIGTVNPSTQGFSIALNPGFEPGLKGLEAFSHALVLWWANAADSKGEREQLIYAKPYTNNPNDVGVFGSRSPSRPNPIGLSVIALIDVDLERGTIVTPYIDTEPGTPVIDIKPYFPASDRVRDVVPPAWCEHWPGDVEESADFDWAAEFEPV